MGLWSIRKPDGLHTLPGRRDMRETYRWTDIPHRQTGPDAHCWMDHSNMDGGNIGDRLDQSDVEGHTWIVL